MAVVTWGMLAKSQIDNETIEQRIAEMIAEHNANEAAHLGVGQSLQSHKASEIIDHVVGSIVADKIKDGEVTTPKLLDTRFIFRSFFESLDAWTQFKTGGRGSISLISLCDVALNCGNQANDYVALCISTGFFTINLATANPLVEIIAYVGEPSSQDMIIFVANDWARSMAHGFGFIYKASVQKFYAWWKKATILYEQELTGIATNIEHRFRAEKSVSAITFSVDGIVKYTATTNLPIYNEEFIVGIGFKAIDGLSPQGQVISFLYIQD